MPTPDQPRSVPVDGARLAYREHGNPHTEPVVLLHDYPANEQAARETLSRLANHTAPTKRERRHANT
jgi:pimeloyl-ACP methyl ester carboxylesterase